MKRNNKEERNKEDENHKRNHPQGTTLRTNKLFKIKKRKKKGFKKMLDYKIKTAIPKLKELNKNYLDFYNMLGEKDFKEYRESLPEGATVPPRGRKLNLERNKEILKEEQETVITKAMEIIGEITGEIKKIKTESPTPEAVEFYRLLSMRGNTTEDDIILALEKYGKNYQMEKALVDLAIQRGFQKENIDFVKQNPIDYISDTVKQAESDYKSLIGHERNLEMNAESFIAVINQTVDSLNIYD